MSLHRSKRYGLPDPRSFLDKSRERLDDPVPHQVGDGTAAGSTARGQWHALQQTQRSALA
jgi:hypothetical protein